MNCGDFVPARFGCTTQRHMRGEKRGQRRRLREGGQEGGTPRDDLERVHATKEKAFEKLPRIRRNELEIRIPVRRHKRLRGGTEHVFGRRRLHPIFTIKAFEAYFRPRRNAVSHAAMRPGKSKRNEAFLFG